MSQRAIKELEGIAERLIALTRVVPVKYLSRDAGSGFILVQPNFHWGDCDQAQLAEQIELVRKFQTFKELVRSMLKGVPQSLAAGYESVEKEFLVWLELSSNWHLSHVRDQNERYIRDLTARIRRILEVLAWNSQSKSYLVPDTNAMIVCPDPVAYRSIAGQENFCFVLLPTVLGELDSLKNLHRNPEFREKVLRVVNRIKGWRNQGSLIDGVVVDKSIEVRAESSEPSMANAPSWLDGESKDDRIIASVLSIVAILPGARVILVTGDVNLLNKADAAWIETKEPPDCGNQGSGA